MPKHNSVLEAAGGLTLPAGAPLVTPGFSTDGVTPIDFIGTSVGVPDGVAVTYGSGYTQFSAIGGFLQLKEVLPFPCIVDRVSISFTGGPGHSAAPAARPTMGVSHFNLNGSNLGFLGSVVYPWTSVGVYEALNLLHFPNSGGGLALDCTSFKQYLNIAFANEDGANALAGLIVHTVQFRCLLAQPIVGR